MTSAGPARKAVAVGLGAALLTGLWWLPMQAIERLGIQGPAAGAALLAGGLPVVLVWIVAGGFTVRATGARGPDTNGASLATAGPIGGVAYAGAAACGTALVLYGAALTDTTVVRAVLLFYLAPLWSLGIEIAWMGRRLRVTDGLSVLLAALGLVAVFRGDIDLSAFRIGDGLAVLAGMAWSVGSALLASGGRGPSAPLVATACATGAAVGFGLHGLLGVPGSIQPTPTALAVVLAVGTVYLAPAVAATLWSARQLPPTTMSYLLTAEIVSGIASAALLLDEPFGLPEVVGSIAILGAALVEVLAQREPHTRGGNSAANPSCRR